MAALAVPLAISGISALAGLLGNRKKTATQESTTSGSSTQNVDLYNNPILSDEASSGYGAAINTLLNRLLSGTDISGYRAAGLRELNRSGDMQKRLLERTLAQRGLSYSPAGAAISARSEDAQQGRLFDFENSIPLLQRQMQGEDIQQLVQAASAMPVGNHQVGTTTVNSNSHTTGTATQPGDMLGGLFSGLGQGIASTYGRNWALDEALKRYGLTNVPGISKGNTGGNAGDSPYNG